MDPPEDSNHYAPATISTRWRVCRLHHLVATGLRRLSRIVDVIAAKPTITTTIEPSRHENICHRQPQT